MGEWHDTLDTYIKQKWWRKKFLSHTHTHTHPSHTPHWTPTNFKIHNFINQSSLSLSLSLSLLVVCIWCFFILILILFFFCFLICYKYIWCLCVSFWCVNVFFFHQQSSIITSFYLFISNQTNKQDTFHHYSISLHIKCNTHTCNSCFYYCLYFAFLVFFLFVVPVKKKQGKKTKSNQTKQNIMPTYLSITHTHTRIYRKKNNNNNNKRFGFLIIIIYCVSHYHHIDWLIYR